MINNFVFTNQAKEELIKLDKKTQEFILLKLKSLKVHPSIFVVLKKIVNIKYVDYRLRIGNYRLLIKEEKQTPSSRNFIILKLAHRKSIYT